MNHSSTTSHLRAAYFVAALVVVTLVGDGFSGRPTPFEHQLLILPATVAFLLSVGFLLRIRENPGGGSEARSFTASLILTVSFEVISVALFIYEAHHFARLGYHVGGGGWVLFAAGILGISATAFSLRRKPGVTLGWALGCWACGMVLAIRSFPLNYLRSDMLAVILWADRNLIHHVNPYTTMYVGGRVYDFPYLPGMLLGYFPAVIAGFDLRWMSMAYLVGMAWLIYRATRPDRRREVETLTALLVLSPFLQYRHELYLEPHWFAMVAAFALMTRGRFAWGAFVFGISMGIYQFSWIMFPFLVLHGWRRGAIREATKVGTAGLAGMLTVVGPFLRAESGHIASNTVGQWGTFGHALADPMNLSYWITYVIAPSHLLRLQALLMAAIFASALFRGRCSTLADTLRWSIVALVIFVMTNSIVDGYFYLMILVPMLFFTCLVNGWILEAQRDSLPPHLAIV